MLFNETFNVQGVTYLTCLHDDYCQSQVGVLAFDNRVWLPSDDCYKNQLALATKANKEALRKFVTELPPRSDHRANYSRAFQRAFELFSATANLTGSASRKRGNRTKLSLSLGSYCLFFKSHFYESEGH